KPVCTFRDHALASDLHPSCEGGTWAPAVRPKIEISNSSYTSRNSPFVARASRAHVRTSSGSKGQVNESCPGSMASKHPLLTMRADGPYEHRASSDECPCIGSKCRAKCWSQCARASGKRGKLDAERAV